MDFDLYMQQMKLVLLKQKKHVVKMIFELAEKEERIAALEKALFSCIDRAEHQDSKGACHFIIATAREALSKK